VFADLIQSLGWVLSAYNLAHDRLWPGIACDVQGFFINVGDVGSSIWALVIAIHTVLLLAGTHRTRAWAAEASTSGRGRWFIVAGIWGFVISLGLVGPVIIQRIQPWNGPFCMMLIRGVRADLGSQQRRWWMVLDWRELPP
jgi:G protein-coupled glucose receptor regulating Gpa2